MLFGPKHDMLELASIPRQRDELQNMLRVARAERRRRRLVNTLATVLVLLTLAVGAFGLMRQTAPASATAAAHQTGIYLPIVTK